MVSLEQIRELENKVNRAVEIIRLLREENRSLRRTVASSQARMKELEELVRVFKNDQAEIERGITNAIRKLDQLEDALEGVAAPRRADAAAPEPAADGAAAEPPIGAQAEGTEAGQLDIF